MSEATRKRLLEGAKYVPSGRTNIAATFARIRREMKAAELAQATPAKVQPIRRKGGV